FPYIYASGFNGYAYSKIGDTPKDLMPLFELIVEKAPAPAGSLELPFLMQAATLTYDDYVGRQACGRILEGTIKKNDTVTRVDRNGNHTNHKIVKIQGHLGLKEIEIQDAGAGDIVILSGIPEIEIGDTICDPNHIAQLPPITLAEPTVSVEFLVNTSPFVGTAGTHVTMTKLRERLQKERRANISLKIEEVEGRDDAIRVCGRGELHLAVLIEAMRREGYELAISKPTVITKVV